VCPENVVILFVLAAEVGVIFAVGQTWGVSAQDCGVSALVAMGLFCGVLPCVFAFGSEDALVVSSVGNLALFRCLRAPAAAAAFISCFRVPSNGGHWSVHITRKVNNIFYSVFSRRQRLLATFSNGRTEFTGSKRMSVVATEVAAKSLAAYLRANKIRYVYFVFTTRFNQFMRAAVRVLRAKRLRIAGFKYTARRAHGLGLRARASRRV
jgi:ribosomal protein S11